MREYRAFSEAETWKDVEDELQAEGCRPVSADAAALGAVLGAAQRVATGVLERQQQFSASMAEGESAIDAKDLTRVRTLRDGPMGMPKQAFSMPKGESLFRKRIAAKAAIGNMVATSKIGYEGPMPSAEEYADAKVAEFKERKGRGPAKELKLQHVEESLDSLAAAAGLEPSHVRPFLEQQGITQELEGPPGIQVKIVSVTGSFAGSAPMKALVEIEPGIEPVNTPVNDARLKELMLEFQAAEAR